MVTKRSSAAREKQRRVVGSMRSPIYSASALADMLNPSNGDGAPSGKAAFNFRKLLALHTVGKTTRKFKSDVSVFSQGDPADAVFFLQSGKIKMTVVSKRGKEVVVAILAESSFFGEGCLAGQAIRLATASTVQPSSVLRVEKLVMMRLLRDEPEYAARFLAYLLSRNVRMESDLVDHLFNNSEKRLARLLLLLANFGQKTKSKPIIAKISQETLAKMIGTTRSRVSFFLNRFRDLDYITYNGGGMHINSSLVSVLLHD